MRRAFVSLFILTLTLCGMDFDALEKKQVVRKSYRFNADDAQRQNDTAYRDIVRKQRKTMAKILPPPSAFSSNNTKHYCFALSGNARNMCLGSWEKHYCFASGMSRRQTNMCLGNWDKNYCFASGLSERDKNLCLGNWDKTYCFAPNLSEREKNICLGKWNPNACFASGLSEADKNMCLGKKR